MSQSMSAKLYYVGFRSRIARSTLAVPRCPLAAGELVRPASATAASSPSRRIGGEEVHPFAVDLRDLDGIAEFSQLLVARVVPDHLYRRRAGIPRARECDHDV
jgi:hypothetical protein